MTADELRAVLVSKGFEAGHADRLASRSRPGIKLTTVDLGGEHAPIGSSKLGGLPDLPKGFGWPRRAGVPMEFVAQINLAEIQAAAKEEALPSRGLLSFFVVMEALFGPGSSPADQRLWHFDSEPGSFERATPPPGPERRSFFGLVKRREPVRVYKPCGLRPERTRTFPGEPGDLPDDDLDRFYGLLTEIGGNHRMLGHAHPIQNEMEPECERITGGGRDREAALARWRLLLQVDTDEKHSDMMWGDSGTLYYWIAEEDLRARRFERHLLICQCC